MPFTLSHPAVVLPLAFIDKKRLSVTALTIGSVTPDFEYFLTLRPVSFHAHKFTGILWYDLPLSVLLFYLFTTIVKDELIDSLPSFLYRRFSRFKNLKRIKYTTPRYLIVVASLLIGITSHLLWDKLTHKSAKLLEDVFHSYSFIWNISSVMGALVIAIIVLKTPKTGPPEHRDSFLFWLPVLSIILPFIIIQSAYEPGLQYLVVAGISGLSVGLLISAAISMLLKKYKIQVASPVLL